jgi:hypothetical protein
MPSAASRELFMLRARKAWREVRALRWPPRWHADDSVTSGESGGATPDGGVQLELEV